MSAFHSQESPAPAAVPTPAVSREERDAIVTKLFAEHGKFLEGLLLRRARTLGIAPESTQDLRQLVLLTVTAHVERYGPIAHERGFLRGVVRKTARNHKKKWRPPIQQGADLAAVACREQDPEGTAELAELRRKLERAIDVLSPAEAKVIRCRSLAGLDLKETAEFLNRPVSSVRDDYERAVQKLKERADDSVRATKLGDPSAG
jgi:RNA polymerase sigma factor (sigma-70 family)